MKTTLACKISLSKKMRSLLQNGGSISLTSDTLESGKGDGLLIISNSSRKEIDSEILLGNETSIMITPIEIVEVAPDSLQGNPVGNIFSNEHVADHFSVSIFVKYCPQFIAPNKFFTLGQALDRE